VMQTRQPEILLFFCVFLKRSYTVTVSLKDISILKYDAMKYLGDVEAKLHSLFNLNSR
jgi:hypothetical protein